MKNLSEKVHSGTMLQKFDNYYFQEDVKDFIKELKRYFKTQQSRDFINSIAGEKLI